MIAHHFHLEFLPTDERLLDQDLGDRRKIEAAVRDFAQLVAIVSNASAHAAKTESRSNDEGERPDFISDAVCIGQRTRNPRPRKIETNAQHRFLEQLSIFAFRDCLRVCSDQLHAVPRERPIPIEFHRDVERGLPAHGWKKRVGFFALDDRFDYFRRDRLDVGAIGKLWIGHDRGRVRVDQDDLITFLAQCLARLHPGIIKFAALPDHDRTGANEQNFFELVIPRHLAPARISEISRTSRANSYAVILSEAKEPAQA